MKVNINKPCTEDWNAMTGDAVHRHCLHCDKRVTNLSAMRTSEARAFLEANPSACVRAAFNEEGHLSTLPDLPSGALRSRLLRRVAAVALGSSFVSVPAVASSAIAEVEAESVVQRVVDRARAWWNAPQEDPEHVLPTGGESAGETLIPEVGAAGTEAPPPTPPPVRHIRMGKRAVHAPPPPPPVERIEMGEVMEFPE